MLGRENDTQRLPVATAVTHKLAIETPEDVLGTVVVECRQHTRIKVFGEIAQRRSAQAAVHRGQVRTVGDKAELVKHLRLLLLGRDLYAGHVFLYGGEDFCAVGAGAVARQLFGVEVLVLQGKQDGGDHYGFLQVAQRPESMQVFVQFLCAAEDIFQFYLLSGLVVEYLRLVKGLDVGSRKLGEIGLRLDDLVARGGDIDGLYLHASLLCATATEGKHFLERTARNDFLPVVDGTIHGIVGNRSVVHQQVGAAVVQELGMLVGVGFVLDDDDKIAHLCDKLGKTFLARAAFGGGAQGFADGKDVAAVLGVGDLGAVEQVADDAVGLFLVGSHYAGAVWASVLAL